MVIVLSQNLVITSTEDAQGAVRKVIKERSATQFADPVSMEQTAR